MSTEWDHKDEWRRRGKNFMVTVTRHSEDYGEGPHRWAVYAYIYPEHPRFSRFNGPAMWQEAATELPMHGGPSLLRWHYDDARNPTSVQVGADYHHLCDERFTHYANAEDAARVFLDADELFDFLSKEAA